LVVLVGLAAAVRECLAAEADAASEELVSSNPSGYSKIGFPGSPGSTKGG
jgi:hypothetical protein